MFIFFKFWSIIVFGVFWLFIKRKLSLILLNIKEETVTDANFRKIMGEGRSTRIFTSKVYFFFVAVLKRSASPFGYKVVSTLNTM